VRVRVRESRKREPRKRHALRALGDEGLDVGFITDRDDPSLRHRHHARARSSGIEREERTREDDLGDGMASIRTAGEDDRDES
jgi:hypothetical protein